MGKLTGFKTYRHKDNPKEKELHDKFIEHYVEHNESGMDLLVFPPTDTRQYFATDRLSDREKRIVITMVQWMGTPLGQSLLRECGFEPVEPKPVVLGKKRWFNTKCVMQGFVYLEDGKPCLCSSTLKWLDKLVVYTFAQDHAKKFAWDYLNKKYPEYEGYIQLF